MAHITTILSLGSALFFGLALVLTQFGLRWLDPLQGAATSIPTTALMFLALSPFVVDWSGWNIPAVSVFVAAGCLFPASVTVLTFEANRRIGPHLTGALGSLSPVFAIVFAALMLGELPRSWQAGGIGVIVIGVTLLFATPRSISQNWPWWTILVPLLAALIRGLIQPGVKLGLEAWPDPFAAALIGYVVSSLVVGVIHASRERRADLTADRRGRFWFAGVGLCNGIAVVTMYAALARASVAVVAPLVAIYPLVTIMFGALFLHDIKLNRLMILGVIVTVAGVVLILVA